MQMLATGSSHSLIAAPAGAAQHGGGFCGCTFHPEAYTMLGPFKATTLMYTAAWKAARLQQLACSMDIVPEELCLHSQSPQHGSFCPKHLHIDVQPAVHHIAAQLSIKAAWRCVTTVVMP